MKKHVFEHCTATEEWSGEYPYSSVCVFVVRDKLEKTIAKWRFTTDINPRGESELQRCIRWCKYYIPQNIELKEVIDYLVKERYNKKVLFEVYEEGMEAVKFFKYRRPYISSGYSRSYIRNVWRCVYSERKFWREMERNPAHLLLYRLDGVRFDYLHYGL